MRCCRGVNRSIELNFSLIVCLIACFPALSFGCPSTASITMTSIYGIPNLLTVQMKFDIFFFSCVRKTQRLNKKFKNFRYFFLCPSVVVAQNMMNISIRISTKTFFTVEDEGNSHTSYNNWVTPRDKKKTGHIFR